jgi:hypothetical protein
LNDLRAQTGHATNGDVIQAALSLLLTIHEKHKQGMTELIVRNPNNPNAYYKIDFSPNVQNKEDTGFADWIKSLFHE